MSDSSSQSSQNSILDQQSGLQFSPVTLEIINPTEGAILVKRSTYAITWNTTGNVDILSIDLIHNNTIITKITSEINDLGKFVWYVDSGLIADLYYQIRIYSNVSSWTSKSFEIIDSIFFNEYPQGKWDLSMTHDELNQRNLLYSCIKSEMYFLDRRSNNWLGIPTTNNPAPRSGCDITYIKNHNVVALFGGDFGGKAFDDYWLFNIDSNSWIEVITDLKPTPRSVNTIIYDELDDQLILHGGIQGITENHDNDYWGTDTWVYSFELNSWQVSVLPLSIAGPSSMATDGSNIYMVCGGLFNWTGTYWNSIPTNYPFGGWETSFAYDEKSNMFVLFGGRVSNTYLLEQDFLEWVQISTPDQPSDRVPNKLIWDSYSSELMTFGGKEFNVTENSDGKNLHDLWTYENSSQNWIQASRTPVISAFGHYKTIVDNPYILKWRAVDDSITSISVYLNEEPIQSEQFISGIGGILSFQTLLDLKEGINIIRIVVDDLDGFTIEEIGYINHEIEQTSESTYTFSSDDPVTSVSPDPTLPSISDNEGPQLPVRINIFWSTLGLGIPIILVRFRSKQTS